MVAQHPWLYIDRAGTGACPYGDGVLGLGSITVLVGPLFNLSVSHFNGLLIIYSDIRWYLFSLRTRRSQQLRCHPLFFTPFSIYGFKQTDVQFPCQGCCPVSGLNTE